MLWKTPSIYSHAPDFCPIMNELIRICEKELELAEFMYDGNVPSDSWGEANTHCFYAGLLAKTGNTDKAFAELEKAANNAISFDNRPEVKEESSLLLGTNTTHRYEFDTADSRPLCKIMRNKWLASEDFDSIREEKRFIATLDKISKYC